MSSPTHQHDLNINMPRFLSRLSTSSDSSNCSNSNQNSTVSSPNPLSRYSGGNENGELGEIERMLDQGVRLRTTSSSDEFQPGMSMSMPASMHSGNPIGDGNGNADVDERWFGTSNTFEASGSIMSSNNLFEGMSGMGMGMSNSNSGNQGMNYNLPGEVKNQQVSSRSFDFPYTSSSSMDGLNPFNHNLSVPIGSTVSSPGGLENGRLNHHGYISSSDHQHQHYPTSAPSLHTCSRQSQNLSPLISNSNVENLNIVNLRERSDTIRPSNERAGRESLLARRFSDDRRRTASNSNHYSTGNEILDDGSVNIYDLPLNSDPISINSNFNRQNASFTFEPSSSEPVGESGRERGNLVPTFELAGRENSRGGRGRNGNGSGDGDRFGDQELSSSRSGSGSGISRSQGGGPTNQRSENSRNQNQVQNQEKSNSQSGSQNPSNSQNQNQSHSSNPQNQSQAESQSAHARVRTKRLLKKSEKASQSSNLEQVDRELETNLSLGLGLGLPPSGDLEFEEDDSESDFGDPSYKGEGEGEVEDEEDEKDLGRDMDMDMDRVERFSTRGRGGKGNGNKKRQRSLSPKRISGPNFGQSNSNLNSRSNTPGNLSGTPLEWDDEDSSESFGNPSFGDTSFTENGHGMGGNGGGGTEGEGIGNRDGKGKGRFKFNQSQRIGLESFFQNNKNPTAVIRDRLANELEAPERSVRVWFQNR